jgi:PII-like signaling protein
MSGAEETNPMRTYPKKRIDIMVEGPILSRVLALLDKQGVTGYSVLPVLAGRGKDGVWHRDGAIGRAGAMMLVFCILDESRVDQVLEPLFQLIQRQIGIVTVSDVQVIRPEHF